MKLKPISITKHLVDLWKKRTPGQLVIQLTDKCNALCPQCGMRKTEDFPRSKLSPDDVKRILDAAACRGVKIVSFTGGEPLLYLDDLVAYIKYAGEVGIEYIRTGTNGFIFMGSDRPQFVERVERLAEKLAETPLRNFWVSIDSALHTVHEGVRGLPGVIKGIEKALPVFHDHGLFPSANLGINRKIGGGATEKVNMQSPNGRDSMEEFYGVFQTAFQEFYRFVISMGFTIVNTCYPMSVHADPNIPELKASYAATSQDRMVQFTDDEKAALFKALFDVVPAFRSKIRIFSPRTSLYTLYKRYLNGTGETYPCRGGIDYFFIDSKDGDTYPCGYRGYEDLGKFWDMDLNTINRNSECSLCDWECFRDPSELLGPLLQGVSHPFHLIKKMKNDMFHFQLWIDDLKYYRTCEFFNGRRPPDRKRLRKFHRSENESHCPSFTEGEDRLYSHHEI